MSRGLYFYNNMYERILSNFAMHVSLTAPEADCICSRLVFCTVKKHTQLLKEGDICRNIYFVIKGCLRIYNKDDRGEEHNILFCPENWWTVDIASFSNQTAAFYAIDALEDTEVLYASYQTLEQLYIDVPKLERFFRILVQNGFYVYQQRITSNLSKDAEERYKLFQKRYPGLELRIAQKHIASYLGITPVFLSMIRSRNIR